MLFQVRCWMGQPGQYSLQLLPEPQEPGQVKPDEQQERVWPHSSITMGLPGAAQPQKRAMWPGEPRRRRASHCWRLEEEMTWPGMEAVV